MKGFPMIEGTEPMKKMHEGAMKKMHASPTKAMSPKKAMKEPMKKMHDGAMKKMHDGAMKKMHDSAMKAMKDPMKKMEGAMKAMDGAMKAMSPKKAMDKSPTKAMSPKKKDELSPADNKRFDNLLGTLNKMNDPINSNRGKSIIKELKKIKPGFDLEDYTLGQDTDEPFSAADFKKSKKKK
jgi:membrane carboxypeptidase/penicillin-binding protein